MSFTFNDNGEQWTIKEFKERRMDNKDFIFIEAHQINSREFYSIYFEKDIFFKIISKNRTKALSEAFGFENIDVFENINDPPYVNIKSGLSVPNLIQIKNFIKINSNNSVVHSALIRYNNKKNNNNQKKKRFIALIVALSSGGIIVAGGIYFLYRFLRKNKIIVLNNDTKNNLCNAVNYYDDFNQTDKDNLIKKLGTCTQTQNPQNPQNPQQNPNSVSVGGFSFKKRSGKKNIFLLFTILLLGVLNITKIIKNFII